MYRSTDPPNEPRPEVGSSLGPIDPTFAVHRSSKDSHPPNALAHWGTIAPRMSGVIVPPLQEALEGADMLYAAPTTYLPHSALPLTAPASAYQDMIRPKLSYPLGQMANTGTHNTPFCVLNEMDRQSDSDTTDRSRSGQPMGPPSACFGRNSRTPLTLDCDDHDSLDSMLPNPLEHAASHRLIKGTLENGKIIPGPRTADITPTVLYETDAAILFSLLPSVPINLRRIPQQEYTPKTRNRSFLQLQSITFSINGVPGFNMQHALDQVFVGLDGRDDPVLENANGPVSCRLLFPGYPTNTRCNQIAVRNWKRPPTPIIRSKLAYEIAKRVGQYLGTLTTIPMDPSADPQWKIGQGCMKLEKMYLVSISWVAKGSVQPEIWVDTDYSWFGSAETKP